MFNPVFVIQAGEPDWWKKRGTLIAYSVRSPKDNVERIEKREVSNGADCLKYFLERL